MKILKTQNILFSITLAAALLPVAAFDVAQAQSDLLPPPFERAEPVAATPTPTIEYLSEDELQRAYERALSNFGQQTVPVETPEATTPENPNPSQVPGQVPQVGQNTDTPGVNLPTNYPQNNAIPVATSNAGTATTPIGKVRLNVNLENMPLERVMENVIQTVSSKSGQWNIRWRLKNENERLRTERVNINAETDFETFMAYLMERINNTTGVQLYVKVFEGSRLIIIADNY